MFDRQEFAKNIFNLVFNIAGWVFVIIAIIVVYLFFNPELIEKYAMILIPALIYGGGMIIASWFNAKKKTRMEKGEGTSEFNLYINQVDFAKHDLLMFLTPFFIIIMFYWSKEKMAMADIFASAIAFVGLYLSKKIYTRKINK